MAFRTNKVPAIEERTVSGSSVSFNSAFALPLKACKVSFSATQAGSGDPSPSNPRAISGVSTIGLTANSTPVSVSLGEERFGGELDVLNGVLTVTHAILELDGSDDEVYTVYSAYGGFTLYVESAKSGTNLPCMANWLKSQVSFDEFGLRIGANSSRFYFLHITDNISGITDIATWRAYLSQHLLEIVYELAEPITIQLSANELSSIIGNNSFSTDTGTLEITFADLQEKSASGSVATFNTALAMPLPSCNIAVNAWQEGSGDPSPVNNRPIHGFSEVNATRAGKNLLKNLKSTSTVNNVVFTVNSDGSVFIEGGQIVSSTTIFSLINEGAFIPITDFGLKYDTDYILNGCPFGGGLNSYRLIVRSGGVANNVTDNGTGASFNIPSNGSTLKWNVCIILYAQTIPDSGLLFKPMIRQASVVDDTFEPYTGNTYTIQLGQEVYGAEVDVVNGVAHVDKGYHLCDGSSDENWVNYSAGNGYYIQIDDMKSVNNYTVMSNYLPTYSGVNNLGIRLGFNNNYAYMYQVNTLDGVTDLASWRAYLQNNPLTFIYPLAEPFDIQLTPTQIETLIGNNTIFADTGDVDLTYKDLDIAKRGNFREVFKLPS